MKFFGKGSPPSTPPSPESDETPEVKQNGRGTRVEPKVTSLACILGFIASLGGFIFGYVRFVIY